MSDTVADPDMIPDGVCPFHKPDTGLRCTECGELLSDHLEGRQRVLVKRIEEAMCDGS